MTALFTRLNKIPIICVIFFCWFGIKFLGESHFHSSGVFNCPEKTTQQSWSEPERTESAFVWSSHEKLNYMIIKCLWNLWPYSSTKEQQNHPRAFLIRSYKKDKHRAVCYKRRFRREMLWIQSQHIESWNIFGFRIWVCNKQTIWSQLF